ncbi:MAG: DUF420 domain-containing protein [Chitinophagaceae bacterium]|nr:DUF420 domain-containing protein [Bacteroidota bacterium]MCC6258793.1 DUF420 domain-containing protein [Chitinophagaceae bacterium]MCW5917846.1 DUF420 domain-containing protein [Ferruginibacter sp.]
MLHPVLKRNDKKAKWIIGTATVIVFILMTILGKYNLAGKVNLPFDKHIFATLNAIINTVVSGLLIAGLITAKRKYYPVHKTIMLTALALSVVFLVSYVCHHLFAGEAIYGDVDGNRVLSDMERSTVGGMRAVYLILLILHIPLAGLVLPFILFAAYRALSGDYEKHKKLVRFVWPVWFFVAVSGVVIYRMISPYYH